MYTQVLNAVVMHLDSQIKPHADGSRVNKDVSGNIYF